MALLGSIGKSLYRGATSKTGMGIIAAGAVIKGLSDTVGQSSINNAMDIAFGTQEADNMMLGTDLTPSLLLAEAGIPGVSGYAKAANLDKYGYNIGAGGAVASIGGIGSAGAIGGAFLGAKKLGIKGAIGGGILGGIIGGTMGAAAVATPIAQYARNNRPLLAQSPNTSLSMANQLNASGDIVLGMHNSRRGY